MTLEDVISICQSFSGVKKEQAIKAQGTHKPQSFMLKRGPAVGMLTTGLDHDGGREEEGRVAMEKSGVFRLYSGSGTLCLGDGWRWSLRQQRETLRFLTWATGW